MNARKILVADDSMPTSSMLKTELNMLGFEVRIANNGVEAVKAALEEDFDLIFMDVYMPVMTGLEATRQITERLNAAGRTIPPIVAITAGASPNQCKEAGMTGFLEKPILSQTLRRYIGDFFKTVKIEDALPKVEKIDLGNIIKSRRTSASFKREA